MPHVNLLSNGKYHVGVTAVGTGYSHWDGLAVTRWRDDAGQYAHAAVWAALAFAALGDADRAWELVGLLNPAHHASTEAGVATCKVEPCGVAGDVYARSPHVGRGGWTWYTGSAGWMYQLLVESLLGLRRCGNQLQVQPLLPRGWDGDQRCSLE